MPGPTVISASLKVTSIEIELGGAVNVDGSDAIAELLTKAVREHPLEVFLGFMGHEFKLSFETADLRKELTDGKVIVTFEDELPVGRTFFNYLRRSDGFFAYGAGIYPVYLRSRWKEWKITDALMHAIAVALTQISDTALVSAIAEAIKVVEDNAHLATVTITEPVLTLKGNVKTSSDPDVFEEKSLLFKLQETTVSGKKSKIVFDKETDIVEL